MFYKARAKPQYQLAVSIDYCRTVLHSEGKLKE